MLGQRIRPVPLRRVALSGAVLAAVMVGVGWMAEHLRHPLPSGGSTVAELDVPAADPRTPIECAQPQPREGQVREDPTTDVGPPVQVSSNELYDCPSTFDGQRVRYRGEVVGAVLRRRNGAWVHLNDDLYADALGPLPAHRDYRGGNAGVGVLIPNAIADEIAFVGGPQTRGDVVEVIGVFHRVDGSAEVAVIHADDGTIAEAGEALPDAPLEDRRYVAFVLLAVAMMTTVIERVAAARR